MKDYQNKIIWISGASSGIGRELSIQLNKAGATVVLSARNKLALLETQKLLISPDKSLILPMDMQQSLTFEEKAEEVLKKFGRIDILINNAGISQRSAARDTLESVDRTLMEVNYFGPILLTKAVLPVMRKQKSGIIATTSSLAGKFGFYLRSSYSASKHALHGFFETLALEEEKYNIRIRILCPGGVKTNISINALNAVGNKHGKQSELQEEGLPVEIAVSQMIKALGGSKQEVFIGTQLEKISLKMKVLFPALFWKVIKRKKPADIQL